MDYKDCFCRDVKATLPQTLLLARLQVAAFLLQIQTLSHVVLDAVMEGLVIN